MASGREGHASLLLEYYDEILEALEIKQNTDFAKALDKCDNGVVTHKMRKMER